MRVTGYMVLIFLALAIAQGCEKDHAIEPGNEQANELALPAGFPMPDIPDDNQYTAARAELGKKLFYDTRLSRANTISCGTCHIQSKGFADNLELATGTENRTGLRNVPTLTNIAYADKLLMDGGSFSLEAQAFVPIEDHNEMDFTFKELVELLAKDGDYQRRSRDAYGRDFDAFTLTRALANFQRTLISGNSPYDQYIFQGNETALNARQLKGMELFFSEKANCSSCHSGFNFTGNTFENIGLYKDYADPGRARITLDPADDGKFKVPTLRNVELTAPYMHDGSLATLMEVVEHFHDGGNPHPNKSMEVKPIGLTKEEMENLVAFLHALTDETFVENAEFRP